MVTHKGLMAPIVSEIDCPRCGSRVMVYDRLNGLERFLSRFSSLEVCICLSCGFRLRRRTPPRFPIWLLTSILLASGGIFLLVIIPRAATKPSAKNYAIQQPLHVRPAVRTDTVALIVSFGAQRKFGVNWKQTTAGVEIVQMGDGVLQRAGMAIGDLICALDGIPLTTEDPLLRARDDLIAGRHDSIRLLVIRADRPMVIELRR